jgi:hypothetical protein
MPVSYDGGIHICFLHDSPNHAQVQDIKETAPVTQSILKENSFFRLRTKTTTRTMSTMRAICKLGSLFQFFLRPRRYQTPPDLSYIHQLQSGDKMSDLEGYGFGNSLQSCKYTLKEPYLSKMLLCFLPYSGRADIKYSREGRQRPRHVLVHGLNCQTGAS